MDWKPFWNSMRGSFSGMLDASEIAGTETIGAAMADSPLAFTAYAMATAFHETAGRMQPIDEAGSDAYFWRRYDPRGPRPDIAKQLGNTQPGDGARFHGRGFVQLTGRTNYARASDELGVDMIAHPETAKNVKIAADALRRGMSEGWFTGHKFSDHLPSRGRASPTQYGNARRIINGQDRADLIAGYAVGYEKALTAGGWQ